MSGDMQSWRPFLSSTANKLHSFKGYLASKDPRQLSPASPCRVDGGPSNPGNDLGSATKQTWTQWAGEKLKRNNQSQGDNTNVETVLLFPGWAARRLHQPSSGGDTHFDAEVYVAGYASRLNNPESMSRSQRTFLRLAKGFASLPKLQSSTLVSSSSSEMMEAREMESLEERFRELNNDPDIPSSDPPSAVGTPLGRSPSNSSRSSSSSEIRPIERMSSAASSVQELHSNLERRLMPFWSSALSNRTIRISLYGSEDSVSIAQALGKETDDLGLPRLHPIASRKVTTTQDGSFQINFGVPWDVLRNHPDGVQVALGDKTTDHDFFVLAELLPPPPSSPTPAAPQPAPVNDAPVFSAQIKIPLCYTPLRVISDIDDTVKTANVLAGARVVFHTVFVRNLMEIVIPGMGDWYTKMWQRGVRFHYVSNGPFEILPILNEFFPLAKLPPGSIKLRSYAGRSLFNGFLSAPAARKRQGVIDILNHFPESQFILVGDSGEQDMELYTEVAIERPQQILAVFIRDARSPSNGETVQPIGDPVGATAGARWENYPRRSDSSGSVKNPRQMSRGNGATSVQPAMTPGPTPFYQNSQPPTPYNKRQVSEDYFSQSGRSSPSSSNGNYNSSFSNSPMLEEATTRMIDTSVGLGSKPTGVSNAEWKRQELQLRVDRARVHMAQSVRFRLFTNPEECVEAFEVLEQLHKGMNPPAT